MLLLMGAPGSAHAQCPRWLESVGGTVPDGDVLSLTTWRPDPLSTVTSVVAGGEFITIGGVPAHGIAAWDGRGWSSFGAGLPAGRVTALTHRLITTPPAHDDLWAADEIAPLQVRVFRWDASNSWSQVGGDFFGPVRALAIFGSGSTVYAAGTFGGVNGVPIDGIASWNGSTWVEVGTTSTTPGYTSLTIFNNELIAGSIAVGAGGLAGQYVARWNGSTWTAFATGLPFTAVRSLAVHNGQLYAAGGTSSSGGVYVAQWTGSAWAGLPTVPGLVGALSSNGGFLYAACTTAAGERLMRWNGTAWSDAIPLNGHRVWAMLSRFDGLWLARQCVFSSCDAAIAIYANSVLNVPGSGPEGFINSLALFDNAVVAVGDVRVSADVTAPRASVAKWTGTTWQTLLSPAFGEDGDYVTAGVYQGSLLESATMTSTDGELRRRNPGPGATWQTIASLNNSTGAPRIRAYADFGGRLVVAGLFDTIGGTSASNIADWDGILWRPLGAGTGGVNGEVYALAVLGNDLIVGGAFTQAAGLGIPRIARWNPIDGWRPLGTAPTGTVYALAVLNGSLYAAGDLLSTNCIARFDGTSWQPVGSGFTGGLVRTLRVIDGVLYAGGHFESSGATSTNGIARWDPAANGGAGAWLGLGSGIQGNSAGGGGWVQDIARLNGELFAGGRFLYAGGGPSNALARWTDTGTPIIAQQPVSTTLDAQGHASMAVTVSPGYGSLSYRWRHNGVNVNDGSGGASPGGGVITGAFTRELAVFFAQPSDAGPYDCVITHTCGAITSASALLSVPGACSGDVDGSGAVNVNDLLAVITSWGACPLPCPPHCPADVAPTGGDCEVGVNDLLTVITHWGPCL